jgi:hypothetical protein
MLLQGIAYLYTFVNVQKTFITLVWQSIQNSIYRIFTTKWIGKNSNNILVSYKILVGTRSFAVLFRSGPPVVFILLARCFVGFPLQHARPGPPVVFISVARYFVALSLGPMPRLHLWHTGRSLLHRPLPPPPPTPGPVSLDFAGTQNPLPKPCHKPNELEIKCVCVCAVRSNY